MWKNTFDLLPNNSGKTIMIWSIEAGAGPYSAVVDGMSGMSMFGISEALGVTAVRL